MPVLMQALRVLLALLVLPVQLLELLAPELPELLERLQELLVLDLLLAPPRVLVRELEQQDPLVLQVYQVSSFGSLRYIN